MVLVVVVVALVAVFVVLNFTIGVVGEYCRQTADERLGDPPPKVDPGAYIGQRHRDGRHPRGPSGSALLLSV